MKDDLFAFSDTINKMNQEIDDRVRDNVIIHCEDGSTHKVKARFNTRQFIDQFDNNRAIVDEVHMIIRCEALNGIELKRCHINVKSKFGSEWFRRKNMLRHSTSEFMITLEKCDEPKQGRKQAVNSNQVDSKSRFRVRRKTTGCSIR